MKLDVDKIKKALVDKLTVIKFNPNHDADGRFASGSGGSSGSGSGGSGQRHSNVSEQDHAMMTKYGFTQLKAGSNTYRKVQANLNPATKDRAKIHKEFEAKGWKGTRVQSINTGDGASRFDWHDKKTKVLKAKTTLNWKKDIGNYTDVTFF